MPGKPNSITQLRVGRLVKAHGLKGALKIELYTDEPERRFVPGAVFSLQVPADSPWHKKTIELTELRWYNGQPVGFFNGVTDRSAAETLVKAILWVDQDTAEELAPDTWYDHQLTGLEVVQRTDEGLLRHGSVLRVDHLPSQDLLVVATDRGEVMVPFVKAIVPNVDLASNTLEVTPPGGLFDEHSEEARPEGQRRPEERTGEAAEQSQDAPENLPQAPASAEPETAPAAP